MHAVTASSPRQLERRASDLVAQSSSSGMATVGLLLFEDFTLAALGGGPPLEEAALGEGAAPPPLLPPATSFHGSRVMSVELYLHLCQWSSS